MGKSKQDNRKKQLKEKKQDNPTKKQKEKKQRKGLLSSRKKNEKKSSPKEIAPPESYITLRHVTKRYQAGEIQIDGIKDLSLHINRGDIAIVVGPSASGKTTLLNVLGGMDTCDSGEIWVDGVEITGFTNPQATRYRRNEIGFVFQSYHLMENLTAEENIQLAIKISKNPKYITDILEKVGLKERRHHFPAQLSGGEQQRVAIARALAKNPKLLLCDEPTGALDYETGRGILAVLQDIAHLQDMTVVIITHNTAITPMGDVVIHIRNGSVDRLEENKMPTPIQNIQW